MQPVCDLNPAWMLNHSIRMCTCKSKHISARPAVPGDGPEGSKGAQQCCARHAAEGPSVSRQRLMTNTH